MEIQASRLRARTGPDGEIVTLDKQDRARWDRLLITHGLAALDRAEENRRHRLLRDPGDDRGLPRQSTAC
jgi:predicted RNA polymerase sigma factor